MLDLRTGKEMTRRETIKGGLGLAAILAAGKAPAMLLGARGVAFGGGWKNPYVTDGLIAMWDGEWNAGGGVHVENPQVVIDLSGHGNNMGFVGQYSFGSNYIYINGVNNSYGYVNGFVFGSPCTNEMCVSLSGQHQQFGRFIGESRGLCTTNSTAGYIAHLYGFGVDKAFSETKKVEFNGLFSQSLKVANATASWYLNGSTISSLSCSNSQYSGMTTIFNRPTFGRGISGKIYNMRFYSRALTNTEIAANYAIDKARFGLP